MRPSSGQTPFQCSLNFSKYNLSDVQCLPALLGNTYSLALYFFHSLIMSVHVSLYIWRNIKYTTRFFSYESSMKYQIFHS